MVITTLAPMLRRLEGCVILITGAGSGIGSSDDGARGGTGAHHGATSIRAEQGSRVATPCVNQTPRVDLAALVLDLMMAGGYVLAEGVLRRSALVRSG